MLNDAKETFIGTPLLLTQWRIDKMELRPRVLMEKNGRIVVPKEIRDKFELKEKSLLEFQVYGENKILITVLFK